LNLNTGAPYRYEEYGFHSFAQLGNEYLGADEEGIYLLEGDTDDGAEIDALAVTGRTDFGLTNLKRVLGAYMGQDSSGQMHLTLVTDRGAVSGPYHLRVANEGPKTERSKFARGYKGRYWQLEIQNAAGNKAAVESIELELDVIGRRVKR
jgi:hypothetical protein